MIIKRAMDLQFSSPFIEERLYLIEKLDGAFKKKSSRPLLSRSGCILDSNRTSYEIGKRFSSPFIEERLYLTLSKNGWTKALVLVPFYRGAVVFNTMNKIMNLQKQVLVPFYRGAVVFEHWGTETLKINILFSSPFIEERLYLYSYEALEVFLKNVLVPFYRGAVVFREL